MKQFRFVLIGLFISVYLIGCAESSQPESSKKKKRAAKTHLVQTIEVSSQAIVATYPANGTLAYRQKLRVFNQEEGQLLKFPFYPGDKVSQGEDFFQLNDELLKAELDKAKAQLNQANKNLIRIRNMSKKNVASQDVLSQAQTDLEVAKADVTLLETRLTYSSAKAPFDGIVTERLAELGDVVNKHSHLLTVINPESLIIEAQVSELVLHKLAKSSPVDIYVDALKQSFPGHISRIHPSFDPITRQGTVEIQFDQIPDNARAGQFSQLTFRAPERQGILIPFDALQRDKRGTFIWIVNEDNKAVVSQVTIGEMLGQQVEILTGLEASQRLIVRGFMGLSPNKSVKEAQQARE